MKRLRVLMVGLVMGNAGAHVVSPKKILTFPIATQGMTRITVENDLIDDIFVYPTSMGENLQRHASGHVFVVGEGVSAPVYLSLITKRGVAQDLKLVPKNKTPEPIVLSYEDPEAALKKEEEHVFEILKTFAKEEVPSGFYVIEPREGSRSQHGLTAVSEQAYSNGLVEVTAFNVKNENDKRVVLDARLLFSPRDTASVFNAQALEPEAQAKFYVLQKKEMR